MWQEPSIPIKGLCITILGLRHTLNKKCSFPANASSGQEATKSSHAYAYFYAYFYAYYAYLIQVKGLQKWCLFRLQKQDNQKDRLFGIMSDFLEEQIVIITELTQEITREPLLHVGPLQEFLGREMVDVGSRVRERMKALREQAEKEYFVLSDDEIEHSKKRELKKPGGDEVQPPRKNLVNGKKSIKVDECMYACDEPSDTCVCCDLCERWFHAAVALDTKRTCFLTQFMMGNRLNWPPFARTA
jgi:hypothetical protein